MKEDDYENIDIYDYLAYCNNKRLIRLSGLITKKQVINLIPKDNTGLSPIHIDIIEEILKKTIPKRRRANWQDASEEIVIFSNGYDFVIELPNKISVEQYNALLNLIYEIKRYEKDYNQKIDLSFEPENLIKEAESKISYDISPNSNEIIVGRPHNNLEEKSKQKGLKEEFENGIKRFKRLIKVRKK
ncbi:MAG: hypothetical protein IKG27_06215 [Bacilli bacterium]|nr:hypothetical protein [Bacilli bacterium]